MLITYFRGGNFFETAFYNPVIDDFDLQITSANATRIVGVNPGTGVVTTFTGTGFPAIPVPPLSGTLSGFSMVDAQGNPLATITGISWGLQAAFTAIDAAIGNNATALLAGLLSLQDITIDASGAVEGLFDLQLIGVTSDITVIGSDFADDIFGSDGNDTINPGAAPNAADLPDVIHGSTGNDTIDYSELAPGNAYSGLTYGDLTGPITMNLNAATNTGTVVKGPGQGTDTIIDVASMFNLGSPDLYGTSAGDSFTIVTGSGSSMWIFGGRGADSYTVTLAEGSSVSMGPGSFDEGATQGIALNATTGVIANDGFGFADTLVLTRLGDVNNSQFSIIGTGFADNIIGSTGRDRLRSNGGNDTINGGAGFDFIQYDRGQLTNGVTVDLVTGVATGSWSGVAFTHALSNIEEVLGSRFNDTIRGSEVAESLLGNDGLDVLDGRGGNDTLAGGAGNDTIIGGTGTDLVDIFLLSTAATIVLNADGDVVVTSAEGIDLLIGVEAVQFDDLVVQVQSLLASGTGGNDNLRGSSANDLLAAFGGADRLDGRGGDDTLNGGDGGDTLNGGTGDDFIFGGATAADLRDVAFGGDGRDSIDGGAGNDELNGGNGNDTVLGGAGADTLVGNADNDLIAGGAGGDLMSGNAGNDTLNGGFGFDRMNGGTGADQFFHQGVADHGSDWIQDYAAAEGDVLAVGIAGATASQFQVNFATTVGAGSASVQEAFVIYRPTGQVLWALVDGGDDTVINLQIAGVTYDLLA